MTAVLPPRAAARRALPFAALFALLGLVASLLPGASAQAADLDDLLPVDEAFVLSAAAPSREAVTLRWAIAEGYYLYRHRTGVEVLEGGTAAGELALPPGKRHTDAFFGEVETYRNTLVATLPVQPAPGATALRLRVRYQGCADLGICFPPQSREIRVDLGGGSAVAAEAGTGLLSSGPRGSDLLGPRVGVDAVAAPGLTITGSAGIPLPEHEAFRVDAATDGPDHLVVRFLMAPGYYLYRDKTTFAAHSPRGATVAAGEWPPAQTHSDPHFGEQPVYFDEAMLPLRIIRPQDGPDTLTLRVRFMGCQKDGVCYPPLTRAFTLPLADAPANATTGGGAARDGAATDHRSGALGVFAALAFALLGGVILNLMPCVLPILSLKVLSVAGAGAGGARRSALWYTTGVVLSFAALGALALGLREAGLALGWGFQLQQPAVVGALALVMFAVGLMLSGVFTLGGGLAGAGDALTRKSGPAGDFFTGVLAVVVAAPCTAPFMGAALAFAFAASPATALGVFVALGLGLALPFLVIGFVPALAARLPRPGAWMERFKQVLAFPMYLTAVWLVWVLAKQRGADAVGWLLGGAVLLALGLWLWEIARFRAVALRALGLAIAAAGVAVLWPVQQLPSARELAAVHAGTDEAGSASGADLAALGAVDGSAGAAARVPPPAADGSLPWTPQALAALRAQGRVVFVNMTADWCVTCKANERTALATATFRDALDAAAGVYLKGDWTDVDPAITAYLREHGAVGVPFYAVYPAGGGEPEVLPNLLTAGIVEAALTRAAGTSAAAGAATATATGQGATP